MRATMASKDLSTTRAWISGAVTDKGAVRAVNEDAVLQADEKKLWAVADGLGGHHIGDVASGILIAGLADVALKDDLNGCVEAIEDKLIALNDEIQSYSRTHINGNKMGSTVVCLHLVGRVGVCLWVGDSRLYRMRGNVLRQLSRDHSHVEELIRRGMLSRKDAAAHPERNVITRAVGADPELQVEVAVFGVEDGDAFLLCSDGLYDVLNGRECAGLLRQERVDVCAHQLLQSALSRKPKDNVSAIVVKRQLPNAKR